MLDYKLLEALAMVVQEGGFERAATLLNLTQSAVSHRIRQLEEQAGQVLLIRSTPPVATGAGVMMLRHYRQVRRLEDDLTEELVPASEEGGSWSALPIGVNADTLSMWLLDGVSDFWGTGGVLPDIRVDDQEQTLKFLRDGEVLGCVTTKQNPIQGCRSEYLGTMSYRLMATPEFAAHWFRDGFTLETASTAPAVIYNRKDELHRQYLKQIFGTTPPLRAAYVPSPERFLEVVARGWVHGMIPIEDKDGQALFDKGKLIEVVPEQRIFVSLYWQCWNIRSSLLERFTASLVKGARRLLPQESD